VPDGSKWCADCQRFKNVEDFPRNRSSRDGRGNYCKPCHNVRGRENRIKNHGSTREYHLRRRYGIGQVEVDAMLADQGRVCAVCDKPDPEHVDHDHRTGRVRGVLCFNCNQALGNVRDSLRVLDQLQEYLLAAGTTAPRIPHVEYRLRGMTIEIAPGYVHGASAS
jgi:hypothetical protein